MIPATLLRYKYTLSVLITQIVLAAILLLASKTTRDFVENFVFSNIKDRLPDLQNAESLKDGLVILIISLLFLIAEAIYLGWSNSGLFRLLNFDRSARGDIIISVMIAIQMFGVCQIMFSLGIVFFTDKVGDLFSSILPVFHLDAIVSGALGSAMELGALWVAFTINDYFVHRLMHSEIFWPLHRIHHSATELNALTYLRSHPGDGIITNIIATIPFTVFDVGGTMGIIFSCFLVLVGCLKHTELPWDFGWIGRWILISPRGHQIHHSVSLEHRNKNYSSFPLWDRLFGTWYAGEMLPEKFGLNGEEKPDAEVWSELINDFEEFLARIIDLLMTHYPYRKLAFPEPSETPSPKEAS